MRLSDYRPTNPFSAIIFAVALILAGMSIGLGITGIVRGHLGWYVAAAVCELGTLGCLHIVRGLESRRIRDEDDARQDAIEDAAALARPYEPEGDP